MPDARFLLLGDSHATAIREAASAGAVSIAGGMLDAGRNLNIAFHRREGSDVIFNDPKVDKLYREYLASIGLDRIGDLKIPLLCTIGMNLVYLSRLEFWDGLTLADQRDARFLSRAALTETVKALISGALEFYRNTSSMGIRTFSVLPPRGTVNASRTWRSDFFIALEEIVKDLIEQSGATVIDHRHLSLCVDGSLRMEFRHPDPADNVHGSEAYGHLVISEMLKRMDTAPSSSAAGPTTPSGHHICDG